MSSGKPFAEACERNKGPILAVLERVLAGCRAVLEIGSGTGQHAVHFAAALGHLRWQPSERAAELDGLRAWVAEAGLPNLAAPLALDVERRPWPVAPFDAVFSANTAHIMAWPAVTAMFAAIGEQIERPGVFVLYGPFRYHGRQVSAGNERFDAALRARDPAMGLRDVRDLEALAGAAGLALAADLAMPANNRTLVWAAR